MASFNVPQHVQTPGERLDWFLLQCGATVDRLNFIGGLQDMPSDWADILFLIASELESHCRWIDSTVVEIRDGHANEVQP